MKALVLTSNGLRHRYFAQAVGRHFDAPFVIAEEKKNYYIEQREQSKLVQEHFSKISCSEQLWFSDVGENSYPNILPVHDINAPELVSWASQECFDAVCLFGTSILGRGWLEAFPRKIVNLHLGLSPFYRGSATLFWPFVNRELHYLGSTIHLASTNVDAGDILARIDAELREREDYYAITNRLIRDSIDAFPSLLVKYLEGRLVPKPQEPVTGRLYRKADFSEAALCTALEYVQSGLDLEKITLIERARKCRFSL